MTRYAECVLVAGLLGLMTLSCASDRGTEGDIVAETFPEAQAEVRLLLDDIYQDAMDANIDGLTMAHLVSPKFTKFGPRSFNRQSVEETNSSEAAFFSSITDLQVELRDVKIDVFGELAIATFYPHFSLVRDGERLEGSSRQTLVFVKTAAGWKIVHEHGTPRGSFPS